MKHLLVYLLICLTFFTACTTVKEEENIGAKGQSIVIKGGFSFGECEKNCKATVVVVDNKITYSSFKNGDSTPLKECSESISSNTVSSLIATIDYGAFMNLPATIGCPDCADGGAEWIELSAPNGGHKVTFEYGKPPVELKALSLFLHTQFTNFQNCQ